MTGQTPLLMIPGPVEVSPAVREACASPPPGHLSPRVIEAFGAALGMMREVWRSGPTGQPFVVAGSGTTAMEMAALNLVEAGDRVLVVHTGYFSDRMAEMLRRVGAEVRSVISPPGAAPEEDEVRDALGAVRRPKALFATHVDTSTGVRIDPRPLARLAREHGALSVFDGVCATAGERFEMEGWGADVYVTASQKAIGLPPGLALLVASEAALAAREARREPPPLVLDWMAWLPIMRAYEERRPAYFATPATNLILALEVGLREILADGIEARVALHERAGRALRAAWTAMGLKALPVREDLRANTLSALWYPEGAGPALVARVAERGVAIAGGLHPEIRERYFRVGHMGYAVTRPDMLLRTVEAVEASLPGPASGAGARAVRSLLG